MTGEKSSTNFVKGAAILGIAGLVSKLFGAIYRIPYQNITGDVGMHVYSSVYPLYTTLLILATAGFPIAISKIVSERLAKGDVAGARKTFRVSSITLGILGLCFFLLLFFGAPFIAAMIGDVNLTLPIKAVSWSLLLVPLVSIMRGYFQGQQNMVPTGVSQVVEQIVRVIFILIASYWMMAAYSDPYLAGTGAVFAAFPGAVAAVLVLFYYWRKSSQSPAPDARATAVSSEPSIEALSNREVLYRILTYAVPICLGALVLPLMPLVDTVTVLNMLTFSGFPTDSGIVLKGIYDRGQPLIQFGTFFATALSLSLVPAISEAVAQNQQRLVAHRTEVAIRLTVMLGLPASVGLALLAEPVNVMVYSNNSGTQALAIQAMTILFATLSIATSGILQGVGKVNLPARHLLIGVGVKLIGNLLLIPLWNISGAALATVLAYFVAMLLNMAAVNRYTGAVLHVRQSLRKPLEAVIVMGILVWLAEVLFADVFSGLIHSDRLLQTAVALGAVSTGGLAYGVMLLLNGGITRDDMRFLPKGERIIQFLSRFGLLRK